MLANLAENVAKDPAFSKIPVPQLVFVTGGDRWFPLLERFPGGDGVVVIPRAGDRLPPRGGWPDWARDDPFRVVAEPLAGGADALSSTWLRRAVCEALKNTSGCTEDIHEAISLAAADYMTSSAAIKLADWLVANRSAALPSSE